MLKRFTAQKQLFEVYLDDVTSGQPDNTFATGRKGGSVLYDSWKSAIFSLLLHVSPRTSKMSSDREALLHAAANFCNAFACQYALDAILDHFSTTSEPFAIEHGVPQLAPFVGRPFKGLHGIKEYFSLLGEHVSYKDMYFVGYIVDTEVSKVSARGTATFTWKATNQSWDEVFTYVLGFDGDRKVRSYEVWADTGAAYLASQRKLK